MAVEVKPAVATGRPVDGAEAETRDPSSHWSFVPPVRPSLPQVLDRNWPINELDYFVLAKLEATGTRPSSSADRVTLIRRATLDLTGLPPTPQEVDAYLDDASPDAFERLAERLLASPRYGEHMARDWLDGARYADTHGYFTDHERFMWRWRDWVIDAFNDNMPFDQFTIEQLAGDLLPNATVRQRIATGFNRNHMVTEETGVIPEEYRTEYVADRVRTTAAVWMGLTAGCAQCHDHKYDPLTQREFYQLFAYFNNLPEEGISGGKKNAAPLLDLASPDQEAQLKDCRERIRQLDEQLKSLAPEATRNGGADESAENVSERKKLEVERETLRDAERRLLAATTTMVMQERDQPRDTFVLVRGQYDQNGERVEPGVPAFLPQLEPGSPPNRLTLARWLMGPQHPLTARVAVNRLWRQIFGEGLIATPEDFGLQGERPSHPELLDYLATEFVRSQWDVKRIQLMLITSATYRQSSHITMDRWSDDQQNRLLSRAARFRLSAESIRDGAVYASGLLMERLGGPSVRPYQPADLWKHITYDRKNTQSYDQSTGEGLYRRSIYTYWKRQVPPPTMQLLDAPTRETCVLRRQRTNTPLQALALLNDLQFIEASRALGQRMIEYSTDDHARVDYGFRLVTARHPTERESSELLRLLERQRTEFRSGSAANELLGASGETPALGGISNGELAAWMVVGNLLLNLDEVLNRE